MLSVSRAHVPYSYEQAVWMAIFQNASMPEEFSIFHLFLILFHTFACHFRPTYC
jgi:hypothetical protein